MSYVKVQKGFTLIELMVTVAIVAILAGVAYPSYIEQVYKSKRATAAQMVLECGAILERRYTMRSEYTATDCDALQNDDYQLAVTVTGLARTGRNCTANSRNNCFLITATPSATGGVTEDSKCQSFTLDETGLRLSLDSNNAENNEVCWRT